MALGIGYGLPFVAQHGTNPYKTQWAAAREGAKGAGASVEDENAGTGSCLVSRGQDVYTDGLPFTPSLLIVPQFYKDGNLYQDVPPFVAEDSTMRFTVSRNTTATRVNSSGLIESVASGVPRIDWLGQSCPGLLIEPSGTNTWLYSEPASATGYTAENVSFVTENLAGTVSAVLLLDSTVNRSLQQSIGNKQGQTWTMFFYVKVGAGVLPNQTGGTYRDFTLTIDNVDVNDAGFTYRHVGNGVYQVRHSRTFTTTFSNAVIRKYGSTNNNVPVVFSRIEFYSGDVPFGVSYIPTTTAAVSRAADDISASGALVSGLIGQTEGTMYAEVDLRNWIASGRILTCSNGTIDERLMIQVGANRTLQAIVTTASADVVDISTASGQVNGIYKCALTYASGDFAFYVNGTQIGTDSSGGVPACTSVFLGKIGTSASTNFLNDRIRSAALYTTRLSNDQLAELTRL